VRIDALEGLQRLMLPDRWQAEAIQALTAGKDVVIDAPTGAGKTYVFERWLEQTNFSRRALFTVPTRALANDKFAEWRARGWRAGIVTGDVTLLLMRRWWWQHWRRCKVVFRRCPASCDFRVWSPTLKRQPRWCL